MDELYHYGTPQHSGRFPYGSGERPYQDLQKEQRKAKIKRVVKKALKVGGIVLGTAAVRGVAKIAIESLTANPILASGGSTALASIIPVVGSMDLSMIHDAAEIANNPEVVELIQTSLDPDVAKDVVGDFMSNPTPEGVIDIMTEHPEMIELSTKIASDPEFVDMLENNPMIREIANNPEIYDKLDTYFAENPQMVDAIEQNMYNFVEKNPELAEEMRKAYNQYY